MIRKLCQYVINILISVLTIFCIYAFISTTILKKDYIKIGNYTFFVVASGSMSGTIDVNDLIIVKITDQFKVNDIITYNKDGYFITHRVVSSKNNQIITKGDVNNTEDTPISIHDVVGKVVLIFPFSVIFEILAVIIFIILIVILFNFEKIFKKYIVKKPLLDETTICSVNDEDSIAEYSVFVKRFLAILKERNADTEELDTTSILIKQLKYVTKSIELIRINKIDLLNKLVNSYPLDWNEKKNSVIPIKLIMQLSDETLNTHVILLLNCIMYGDKEVFDTIFMSFKLKINKEYKKISKLKNSTIKDIKEKSIIEKIKFFQKR